MIHRALAAALGGLVLITLPAPSLAQSTELARADVTGGAGGVAAPARSSADQIRADIWATNAERKTEHARKDAEYKASLAAYEAESARVAAETARIRSDDAARQAAYAAELATYRTQLATCKETLGRGCRWPSPPPRRHPH